LKQAPQLEEIDVETPKGEETNGSLTKKEYQSSTQFGDRLHFFQKIKTEGKGRKSEFLL